MLRASALYCVGFFYALLIKGAIRRLQFNLEQFIPGNYMVELLFNEEHYIEKLVKL